MKKLILLLMVSLPLISMSQESRVGIKAGTNFTKIAGDNVRDIDSRMSFQAGVIVEIPLTEKLSLQPEVLYISKGFTDTSETDEIHARLNYLSVPFLAKYYITDQISLETGPQFGMLLSAKTSQESQYDQDISSGIKNTDYGWVFGATVKIYKGLHASVSYDLGLADINNLDSLNIKYKNRTFQIALSYVFKS